MNYKTKVMNLNYAWKNWLNSSRWFIQIMITIDGRPFGGTKREGN
ncbi:MAG: hypothetical protein ACTS41_00490 [Candidatus Hodgkinia cicadicola]